MLRGFFLIFLLLGIAMVAFLGFRGQKSTGAPIEVFPDMVRQPKVRAQAPLGFFADNRGARVPIAGTVPMGYEMPQPSEEAAPGAAPVPSGRGLDEMSFGSGTDYVSTGKMGANWGTGIPMEVNAKPYGARTATFQRELCDLSRGERRGQRHREAARHGHDRDPAR